LPTSAYPLNSLGLAHLGRLVSFFLYLLKKIFFVSFFVYFTMVSGLSFLELLASVDPPDPISNSRYVFFSRSLLICATI
jgi:hypothetical protein